MALKVRLWKYYGITITKSKTIIQKCCNKKIIWKICHFSPFLHEFNTTVRVVSSNLSNSWNNRNGFQWQNWIIGHQNYFLTHSKNLFQIRIGHSSNIEYPKKRMDQSNILVDWKTIMWSVLCNWVSRQWPIQPFTNYKSNDLEEKQYQLFHTIEFNMKLVRKSNETFFFSSNTFQQNSD